MSRFLPFQDVQQHRDKAMNSVGVLTLLVLEVIGVEGVEGPEGQRMSVD
jgi:hypothetical protein